MKQPAVYILASKPNGTLYVGVTSKLAQRIYQHRHGIASGFAGRFGCKSLVWFELHETMESAIAREKQIKAGSRTAKVRLIMAANPEWADLYEMIV